MLEGLTDRQRALIDAALVLAVIALSFIVLGFVASVFYAFFDILVLFFLAWLLSFALLPLINGLTRIIPRLTQTGAVIVVYLAIVVVLLFILVEASAALASSINQFILDAPTLQDQLTNLLTGLQERLAGIGMSVDLVSQAPTVVANLQDLAGEAVGPLQSVALASIGVFGNILLLVILSIYIAIDRDEIIAFLYRLVPPGYVTEARLLQTTTSKSFGGFLRGQVVMGLFFGPFVSWLPPVAVALLLKPDVALPVLIVMGIAWFVTMNIISPRLMAGSVGIHPIVVLASVVIGGKIAGIVGAIFGIPIAAVLSAFFFYWFGRSREGGTVAERATQRVAAREGRQVRRPVEPVPGVDADVDEVAAPRTAATGEAAEPSGPGV
jgi:predicted PurR-regulated permease PerM